MSNQEQGIAQTRIAADQARLARGEKQHEGSHSSSRDFGERVFLYLGIIAFLGLIVLWATATSPLLLYGSFAFVLSLVFAWGWLRIGRIARTRDERARQVAVMKTDK